MSMPRAGKTRRAKVKAADDKAKLDQSLSWVSSPLPPSPGECPLSTGSPSATTTMDIKDIEMAVTRCLSDDTFVNKLVDRLTERVRDAVVDTLSESLKVAHSRIEELSGEVNKLKLDLQRVELRALDKEDELEQYQRRNSLRIFGVPESRGEVMDDVVVQLLREKIGVDMPLERVERTHRVGKPQPPGDNGVRRSRPIIVKFRSYRDRHEVFTRKKCLKGTGVTVREDLTPRRAAVLRKAIELHGLKRVWTTDGRIIWEDGEGNRKHATSLKDLE